MAWFSQPRTLELSGDALPKWLDQPLFAVARVKGRETLGQLYDYEVELSTIESPQLPVYQAQALVDLDKLIGQTVTLSVAIEGNGTWIQGAPGNQGINNIGADVRTLTGLIVEAQCIGADDRRAFYTLRIRPWLYLATLTRNSRIFQGLNIVDLSKEVLNPYQFPIELRLTGPFLGKRAYPKRDYQRQWWETDFQLLDRLWQEWGLTYFFNGLTLVLCDSPGAFKEHGPAYQTIRYLDRGAQRIDEEHIHEFKVARQLTTGKVTLVDYDYTRSQARLGARQSEHSERAFDNAEEYAWGDYSQPLASPQGAIGRPNDPKFEAEHLARVRVEAHRAQSLQAMGRGNLRGVMTGHVFTLAGYPLTPGDGQYLVVSTELEIVNNDTITSRGSIERKYKCETSFTAIPANTPYRTPQTAVKPRAYGEMAEVMGFDDESRVFTDEYGRVKVCFIWDRLSERNDTASCWLQVASPWHGPGYGAVWTPRVGQMVQVGYFDSDPDRPYVVSAHTTDIHQMPWKLPKNSALSGWRSRDLEGASANSFVTDDTPGQQQVQVTSDQAHSRLVLGHNTRIDGHEGLTQPRGEGFELATEAHGVARANSGMLLTTESRSGAGAPVKDMGETQARLTQARAQHEEFAQLAQRHSAQQADVSQHDAAQEIKAQNEAIKGGAKSLRNPSPEMTRPDVVVASAAGIVTSATDSTHQASLKDHALTAGRDVSVSSGRSFLTSVRGAISMFAYQLGVKLVAAHGKVEIQAQSDQMALAALKDITVSSSEGKVIITAEKEIWIGAGGSYIQINGSGIVNGSPGPILEKGATWAKVSAHSERPPLGAFKPSYQAQYKLVSETDGTPLFQHPYTLALPSGRTVSGVTNELGETTPVFTENAEDVVLHAAKAKKQKQEPWHLAGGGSATIFADYRDDTDH
jgi:type VI secretion system secreted protein VgrG